MSTGIEPAQHPAHCRTALPLSYNTNSLGGPSFEHGNLLCKLNAPSGGTIWTRTNATLSAIIVFAPILTRRHCPKIHDGVSWTIPMLLRDSRLFACGTSASPGA